MSQIDLKFDSEQNAFGLTDDFDDLYIQKSQPVANGWLLTVFNNNFVLQFTSAFWTVFNSHFMQKDYCIINPHINL